MQQEDQFITTLHAWMGTFMKYSMRSFILYSKETGLSMSQYGALFRILRGASGVSDLGDELGITSAAASQMLDRLVQQELISRTEDPHDRRAKQIVLTEKGRQMLQGSITARQNWLEELAQALTPAEKEQVAAALNLLIEKTKTLEVHIEPER